MHHAHDAEVADAGAGPKGDLRHGGGHGRVDRGTALQQRLKARPLRQAVIAAGNRALAADRLGIAGPFGVFDFDIFFPFARRPLRGRQVYSGGCIVPWMGVVDVIPFLGITP